jgi:hypothetical protein
MEILVPPLLTAVREVRWMMNSGSSMKEAFRAYLDTHSDPLATELREHWTLKWQAHPRSRSGKAFHSSYKRAFWELVERGCAGQPVLDALTALEDEVEQAAQAELDLHIATLPFKVLLPLLLFQFPAHLILLLGPLLRELNRQLGG